MVVTPATASQRHADRRFDGNEEHGGRTCESSYPLPRGWVNADWIDGWRLRAERATMLSG
jgi:hypothetical protein